jgi:hypothetical protein
MRIAGGLISTAHLACGLLGWLALGVPGAMLLFGLCAAVSLGLALVASRLMQQPPDGDGGIGTRGPATPPEPPWWPDFERDFRDYAEDLRSGVAAPQ